MYKFIFLVVLSLFLIGYIHCAGNNPNVRFSSSETAHQDPENDDLPAGNQSLEMEEPNSLEGVRLYREIQDYLGVPYRWGGTTSRGMDCSGFVSTVYRKALEIELPRSTESMFHEGIQVSRRRLVFGDLVFFRKSPRPVPAHVGIYVGRDAFVHSSTSSGVIISSLEDKYYRRRYLGAKRIYEN